MNKLRWHIFTDFFEKDSNLVALGPYISCEYNKHIQSFAIALDRRGLDVLEKTWRCPCINEYRGDWILDTEVVLTKNRIFFFLFEF